MQNVANKVVIITGASMGWVRKPPAIWCRQAQKSSWARAV